MIVKHSNNGNFPLVLLHGWGLNSGVWDQVTADLEPHFDVHRICLPGFGDNHDKPIERFDLDLLAELVAPVCPDGSIIAGWSLGGLVASHIALKHPEKASSVCLIASSPRFVEQEDWKGIKPDVLEMFTEDLAADSQKTVDRFLAIQAIGSVSAKHDIKSLRQAIRNYPAANIDALYGGLDLLATVDMREELRSLDIPIKGIFGRLDSLVALHSIEKFSHTLKDFDYRVLPKASHAPFISHRAEFVEHLLALYQGFEGL